MINKCHNNSYRYKFDFFLNCTGKFVVNKGVYNNSLLLGYFNLYDGTLRGFRIWV